MSNEGDFLWSLIKEFEHSLDSALQSSCSSMLRFLHSPRSRFIQAFSMMPRRPNSDQARFAGLTSGLDLSPVFHR